jgi:hypothetical protein
MSAGRLDERAQLAYAADLRALVERFHREWSEGLQTELVQPTRAASAVETIRVLAAADESTRSAAC